MSTLLKNILENKYSGFKCIYRCIETIMNKSTGYGR